MSRNMPNTTSIYSGLDSHQLSFLRDGLMGDLSEDGEQKPEVVSQEKKGRLQEPRREAEQADTTRDGSHTPSSQQLDRPEGKVVFSSIFFTFPLLHIINLICIIFGYFLFFSYWQL